MVTSTKRASIAYPTNPARVSASFTRWRRRTLNVERPGFRDLAFRLSEVPGLARGQPGWSIVDARGATTFAVYRILLSACFVVAYILV